MEEARAYKVYAMESDIRDGLENTADDRSHQDLGDEMQKKAAAMLYVDFINGKITMEEYERYQKVIRTSSAREWHAQC